MSKTATIMEEKRDELTVIEVIDNGPLRVTGKICLSNQAAGTTTEVTEVWLCRCGKSANKPFCDGSHKS